VKISTRGCSSLRNKQKTSRVFIRWGRYGTPKRGRDRRGGARRLDPITHIKDKRAVQVENECESLYEGLTERYKKPEREGDKVWVSLVEKRGRLYTRAFSRSGGYGDRYERTFRKASSFMKKGGKGERVC